MAVLGQVDQDAQTAAEYIARRLREWRGLEATLVNMQHTAAELAYRAKQAGRPDLAERAKDVIRTLGAINQNYTRWQDVTETVLSKVPGLGGIWVPLAMAGTVVALAGAMYGIFRKVSAEERVLQMIEDGVLTAEEAAGLNVSGGGLADVARLTLFGALGLMALQAVRR